MKRPVKPAPFSPRGDRCPICKRPFHNPDDCPHSVSEANARLESDYIHAVVQYELAQAKS